ncbi:hypothetical protein [Flavobacterium sp.]|jgi:hypothetical protein|uniref:hypothetical protein n=1 Tax=Flavobacterium sp. TaxID=239 RepID=UPI0037BE622B
MKKSISLIAIVSVIILLNACSSVTVLNSWKADNASTVKEKNLLVIARTDNNTARIAFENEIVNQLTAKGIKATASFTKYPKLNPDKKITDEKADMIKSMLKDAGFNGVVLTVIKETQELSKTVTEGGGYAGGTYYGYYPRYYGGFYGYYYNPMSYSTLGNYVEQTSTTYTSKNYILETVVYNLDEPEEKQLVAVVTSKIEEPENAAKAAKQYVRAISKSFDN